MPPTDPLSNLLKTWRHQPPADPRFQAEVWERIQAAGSRTEVSGIISRLLGVPAQHFRWAMPIAASLILAFAALVGIGAGQLRSALTADARNADAYAHSIDPLQMTGAQDIR